MAIRKVLMIGDPALREVSEPVEDIIRDVPGIIVDLKDTLIALQKEKGLGSGLAAPQIGALKRVIFINSKERTFVLINPKYVRKSQEMIQVWDTCFSFDLAFFVKVTRHRSVAVKWMDELGREHVDDFDGEMGEIVQHEIDHLDGVLAVDRAVDCREVIMRDEWEKRMRGT